MHKVCQEMTGMIGESLARLRARTATTSTAIADC
jgi:hypothetical protein